MSSLKRKDNRKNLNLLKRNYWSKASLKLTLKKIRLKRAIMRKVKLIVMTMMILGSGI